MATKKTQEFDELECLNGQIAALYAKIEKSNDWDEKECLLHKLDTTLEIRDRHYHSESDLKKQALQLEQMELQIKQLKLQNDQIEKTTKKLSKINWGNVLEKGIAIGIPAMVTVGCALLAKGNLHEVMQFETENRVTSLSGKTIVGPALRP